MSGFTKLSSLIIHSSVWREDDATRIVWVTMLAMADMDGIVEAAVPGLADAARVPISVCIDALEKFTNPDPYSRTKDFDGRRIEETDGGWRILNYQKYRKMHDAEERRRKAAERQARHRERLRENETSSVSTRRNAVSRGVTHVTQNNDIAEAEAEAEAEASPKDQSILAKDLSNAPCKSQNAHARVDINKKEKKYNKEFERFWREYPQKRGKQYAYQVWKRKKPQIDIVLAAVAAQKKSRQWMAGYVPNPATWLNRGHWEDELNESDFVAGENKSQSAISWSRIMSIISGRKTVDQIGGITPIEKAALKATKSIYDLKREKESNLPFCERQYRTAYDDAAIRSKNGDEKK
jgi:hypothetical protein